jgi:hypothetical protein
MLLQLSYWMAISGTGLAGRWIVRERSWRAALAWIGLVPVLTVIVVQFAWPPFTTNRYDQAQDWPQRPLPWPHHDVAKEAARYAVRPDRVRTALDAFTVARGALRPWAVLQALQRAGLEPVAFDVTENDPPQLLVSPGDSVFISLQARKAGNDLYLGDYFVDVAPNLTRARADAADRAQRGFCGEGKGHTYVTRVANTVAVASSCVFNPRAAASRLVSVLRGLASRRH